MLDWERMFRRYVYDPERMPYGRAPEALTRSQANYEIFVICLFTGIVFAVLALAALSGRLPHGSSVAVPIYCAVTAWAAAVFGWTKHPFAGAVCAIAPLSILLYFAKLGIPAAATQLETGLAGLVLFGWLAYGWRIVRIARAYPLLPAGKPMSWRRQNPYQ